VLFRDLVERHDISHPRAVLDLAHRLIDNTGSLYSINSLTGYLKSIGHKAPKSAVSAYLEWFEDAYFLFTVRIFDASLARSKTNPKKIYCVDHAMVTSVASGILANTGHLLENLVFAALRRVTPGIWYCKTKGGLEVDFLAQLHDRSPACASHADRRMLIQVCESLAEPQTRKRELAALAEAMAGYGLNSGIVVTRNEEDRIEVGAGKIEIMPAWRFLLSLPES
jgi:predicted AAA+ superfamily ATPase